MSSGSRLRYKINSISNNGGTEGYPDGRTGAGVARGWVQYEVNTIEYIPNVVTRSGDDTRRGEPWPLSSVWAERPPEARACPIRVSLGVLGRKWALVVLRDVAFRPESSFTQILSRTRGLTPRVLSMRLRDLRAEGLVEKVADGSDERRFHYRLTAKGVDAVPILTALVAFGIRHHADEVFVDARPRRLEECFPGRAPELLGALYDFAKSSWEPPAIHDAAPAPTPRRSPRTVKLRRLPVGSRPDRRAAAFVGSTKGR